MNLIKNHSSNLVSFNGLGSSVKSLFSQKTASAVNDVVQETSNAAVPGNIALASLGIKVKKGSNVVHTICELSDKKLTKFVNNALAEESKDCMSGWIHKMPKSLVTLLKEENLPHEKVTSIIEDIRKYDLINYNSSQFTSRFYPHQISKNNYMPLCDPSITDRRILVQISDRVAGSEGKVAVLTSKTLAEAQRKALYHEILENIPTQFKDEAKELLDKKIIYPEWINNDILHEYQIAQYPKQMGLPYDSNYYYIKETPTHSVLLDLLKTKKGITVESKIDGYAGRDRDVVYALSASNGKTIVPKNNQEITDFIVSLFNDK